MNDNDLYCTTSSSITAMNYTIGIKTFPVLVVPKYTATRCLIRSTVWGIRSTCGAGYFTRRTELPH